MWMLRLVDARCRDRRPRLSSGVSLSIPLRIAYYTRPANSSLCSPWPKQSSLTESARSCPAMP